MNKKYKKVVRHVWDRDLLQNVFVVLLSMSILVGSLFEGLMFSFEKKFVPFSLIIAFSLSLIWLLVIWLLSRKVEYEEIR